MYQHKKPNITSTKTSPVCLVVPALSLPLGIAALHKNHKYVLLCLAFLFIITFVRFIDIVPLIVDHLLLLVYSIVLIFCVRVYLLVCVHVCMCARTRRPDDNLG